jgi:hypothetical protein
MPLTKEQQHQLVKFQKLYLHHCLSDNSQMVRVDKDHYVFRTPTKTKGIYLDAETKAEFEKVRYLLFMSVLM